jgi:hypothetical protein
VSAKPRLTLEPLRSRVESTLQDPGSAPSRVGQDVAKDRGARKGVRALGATIQTYASRLERLTDLALADDSVAGIVAFWSVIRVPDHVMPGVLEQFRRVLRPQGLLLVGFHVGDETRHTSEGYTGRPINVDSHHRRPSKVMGWLRDAGFTIEAELVIGPDEDVPGAVIFAHSDA